MSKTIFFGHAKIVQGERNTKFFFIFLQRTNKYKLQVVQNKQQERSSNTYQGILFNST